MGLGDAVFCAAGDGDHLLLPHPARRSYSRLRPLRATSSDIASALPTQLARSLTLNLTCQHASLGNLSPIEIEALHTRTATAAGQHKQTVRETGSGSVCQFRPSARCRSSEMKKTPLIHSFAACRAGNSLFDAVMPERSPPKVAGMLTNAFDDLLACATFPGKRWRQIWSMNSLSSALTRKSNAAPTLLVYSPTRSHCCGSGSWRTRSCARGYRSFKSARNYGLGRSRWIDYSDIRCLQSFLAWPGNCVSEKEQRF